MPKQELTVPDNPMVALIEKALINPELPVDRLEKLLDMQIRVRDDEARRAYFEDMSKCQQNMPVIIKDKERTAGPVKGNYASIDQMIKQCLAIASDFGFSISFDNPPSTKDGWVYVTAECQHKLGFSKLFTMDSPYDNTGNKSPVHAKASAVTYCKRYLLAMIFCLATGDDDDANMASNYDAPKKQYKPQQAIPVEIPTSIPAMISMLQKSQLLELIDEADSSVEIVLKKCNVPSLDELTVDAWKKVMRGLTDKIATAKAQDAQIINEQPEGLLNG